MYRNSEGYASPTEGAALAHIIHEERMKRRMEQLNRIREQTGHTGKSAKGNQYQNKAVSK